jgi:hypothetical protein
MARPWKEIREMMQERADDAELAQRVEKQLPPRGFFYPERATYIEPDEPMVGCVLPDSGARSEFETGAVRDASVGKGLPSLIPPIAIRKMARRFEDGATKYGRDNWQKGIPLSRYVDAIFRHTLAAVEGQQDEDHIGAVLWNAAAWAWTEQAIENGRLPESLDDLTYREEF